MINIVNECDYKYDEGLIVKYSEHLNKSLGNKKLFSLVFVDESEIQKINKEFRNLDKPTDVLSFEDFSDDYLGDIIICVEVMERNASLYGHDIKRELLFLLTHGYLHLNGYDHLNESDEKEMFELQNRLLEEFGVSR